MDGQVKLSKQEKEVDIDEEVSSFSYFVSKTGGYCSVGQTEYVPSINIKLPASQSQSSAPTVPLSGTVAVRGRSLPGGSGAILSRQFCPD